MNRQQELGRDELDRGIGHSSRGSLAHGAGEWTRHDVTPPVRHRLYRATASEHSVLGEKDQREPVCL